jgi:hypothetical protein
MRRFRGAKIAIVTADLALVIGETFASKMRVRLLPKDIGLAYNGEKGHQNRQQPPQRRLSHPRKPRQQLT